MESENPFRLISKLLTGTVLLCLLALALVAVLAIDPTWLVFDREEETVSEWQPKNLEADLASASTEVRYGYELIAHSSKNMGPLAPDPARRYAGNSLSCQNCHLGAGTVKGSASFIGVPQRFPQFRGRENKMGTLAERINGCMERSMNGRAMPEDSKEMEAIIAYMEWLSEEVPEAIGQEYKGFVSLEILHVKADLLKGKEIFTNTCVRCHQADGQGERPDPNERHVYPPLWGDDSFNHGAGMHRVITAARFIKGNMPFDQASWDKPVLSDEEAYHVAAYINSLPRPQKSDPHLDFPDKTLKPVSTPYGPWTDPFTPEQHKYGPFQPIIDYYQKEYGIKKSK